MRKRRTQHRRRQETGSKGWLWLLFGVFLGVVLGGVGYLKWSDGRPVPVKKVASQSSSITAQIVKPKFDFYTLLPEMKVEPTRPSQTTAAAPSSPKATSHHTQYRLQLAAFPSYQDADNLKARLAFQGLIVEIQSIKLKDGKTWYRVQTPVFKSEKAALQAQGQLKAQAINSILLPVNG